MRNVAYAFASIVFSSSVMAQEATPDYEEIQLAMEFVRFEEDGRTAEFEYDVKARDVINLPTQYWLVSVDRDQNLWPQGEGDLVLLGTGRTNVEWHVWKTSAFPMQLFVVRPSDTLLAEFRDKVVIGDSVSNPDFITEVFQSRVSGFCAVSMTNDVGTVQC